jgi:hypothetical protein
VSAWLTSVRTRGDERVLGEGGDLFEAIATAPEECGVSAARAARSDALLSIIDPDDDDEDDDAVADRSGLEECINIRQDRAGARKWM